MFGVIDCFEQRNRQRALRAPCSTPQPRSANQCNTHAQGGCSMPGNRRQEAQAQEAIRLFAAPREQSMSAGRSRHLGKFCTGATADPAQVGKNCPRTVVLAEHRISAPLRSEPEGPQPKAESQDQKQDHRAPISCYLVADSGPRRGLQNVRCETKKSKPYAIFRRWGIFARAPGRKP